MKKIIFTLLLSMSLSSIAQNTKDEGTKFLKTFYTKYINESFKNNEMDSYLSDCFNQKYPLLCEMLGIDVIVRAQDVTPQMLTNLQVTPIKNKWYKVSYFTNYNNKKEQTNIYVKLNNNKITDIYPWHIDTDVIDAQPAPPAKIANTNALTFVKTFYENYLNAYFDCPNQAQKTLKAMQQKYCTQKFINKIASLKKYRKEDSNEYYYDPLIDNSYFDKSFLKSVTITQASGKIIFQYTNACNIKIQLHIHTQKSKDNTFLIDDVSIQ